VRCAARVTWSCGSQVRCCMGRTTKSIISWGAVGLQLPHMFLIFTKSMGQSTWRGRCTLTLFLSLATGVRRIANRQDTRLRSVTCHWSLHTSRRFVQNETTCASHSPNGRRDAARLCAVAISSLTEDQSRLSFLPSCGVVQKSLLSFADGMPQLLLHPVVEHAAVATSGRTAWDMRMSTNGGVCMRSRFCAILLCEMDTLKLRRGAKLSTPFRSALPSDLCRAPICGKAASVLVLPVFAPDAIPGTGASFLLWAGPVGRVRDPFCRSRPVPCARQRTVSIESLSRAPSHVACVRRGPPRDTRCPARCDGGRPCQVWYVAI